MMGVKQGIAGILFLLLISPSAMAAWVGHFVVGGSGGYNWRDGYVNITDHAFTQLPPRGLVDSTDRAIHLSDHGFLGGVFGGYQIKCHRLLVGFEMAGDWDNADRLSPFHLNTGNTPGTTTSYAASVRYKKGTALGLTFRAGYKAYTWLMPYVRLGTQTSRDTLVYDAHSNIGAVSSVLQSEEAKRVWKILAGVGVEVPLFSFFSGRLEYNYTSKGSFVKSLAVSMDAPLNVASPLREHFLDTNQEQHTIKASLALNFPNIF